jgi:hypothetical protein
LEDGSAENGLGQTETRTAVPFQGAGGHGRSVANTEAGLLAQLLVKVLFGQSVEFLAVLLLDGTAFAVKGLDIIEPCDSACDPGIDGFEGILQPRPHVSPVALDSGAADLQPTNLQLGTELRRDINLGHAESVVMWKAI